VNPTSVMGATKRIGELIMASHPDGPMRCICVRFGNVLGSNGSLVPILQEQLRTGQPLTITHPEVRRFFMTTQEAVSLVLQAFAIGSHRDILVLDMGESLQILELAKTLVRLCGRSEDEVEFVFTGLRQGEKFYEELFYESEEVVPSSFDKIKLTRCPLTDWQTLHSQINRLAAALRTESVDELKALIAEIIPEYACREGEIVMRMQPTALGSGMQRT